MLPWRRPGGLVPPPDGHDHTDDDCGRDNYAEKVLKDDRTRVGPGDNVGDALCQVVSYLFGLSLYPRGADSI